MRFFKIFLFMLVFCLFLTSYSNASLIENWLTPTFISNKSNSLNCEDWELARLEQASKAGNFEAMVCLGKDYEKQGEYRKALSLFKKSAKYGFSHGQLWSDICTIVEMA